VAGSESDFSWRRLQKELLKYLQWETYNNYYTKFNEKKFIYFCVFFIRITII